MGETRIREDAWHLEHQHGDKWFRPFPPIRTLQDARKDLQIFRDLNPENRYRLVHECRYVEVVE